MKPFAIPTDWSPAQAMAVVDLLDELRCHIWAKYELALQQAYREEFAPDAADDDPSTPFVDDPIDF